MRIVDAGVRPRLRIAAAALVACVVTAAAMAGPSAAAVPAWTTYRHDALRSGMDPDSAAPVAPVQSWQTTPALDGQVFGSPLVYGSRVYVATEERLRLRAGRRDRLGDLARTPGHAGAGELLDHRLR